MFSWLYILALVAIRSANGEDLCTESSYGTEFIFGFMDLPFYTSTYKFTDASLTVQVTSKSSARYYVTLPGTDSASKTPTWSTKRHYVNKKDAIDFNSTFINRFNPLGAGKPIRIHSTSPIAVLAVYKIQDYVVSTPILPVNALTTSYVLPSYTSNSVIRSHGQVLVVALNDSTSVRLEGYDLLVTKKLNKNETYVYESRKDISGASITSTHPIAVFSSVSRGYNLYSSHQSFSKVTSYLSMQVPPIDKTALHFIVPALPSAVKSYKVRIYASSQEASVEIHSSSSTKHMHVYERIYYEFSSKGSNTLEILSDKPIMVVQIALNDAGEATCMTNIPAASQYLTSYLSDSTHLRGGGEFYVIIIRYEEALGLLVDGKPALHNPELVSHRTPLGNYTVFTIPMATRDVVSHVGNEQFGLFVYGSYSPSSSGTYYSYYYSAGMRLDTACPHTTAPSQIVG